MKEHQKKYYGSLFAIVLLIAATAFVLGRIGLSSANSESSDFASGDLAGMAVIPL